MVFWVYTNTIKITNSGKESIPIISYLINLQDYEFLAGGLFYSHMAFFIAVGFFIAIWLFL